MSTASMFFLETTTPLGGSATYTGPTRDAYGVGTAGSVSQFCYFQVVVSTNQTGTLNINASTNGTTWSLVATASLAATGATTLKVPITQQFSQVVITNGSTTQTALNASSAFTVS